jgi:hypothetical protein
MSNDNDKSAVEQANDHVNELTALEDALYENGILETENEALRGLLIVIKSSLQLEELTTSQREMWISTINFLLYNE